MMRKGLLLFSVFIILYLASCQPGNKNDLALDADIVIYGGTSAAVTGARQAVEMSMNAAIFLSRFAYQVHILLMVQ